MMNMNNHLSGFVRRLSTVSAIVATFVLMLSAQTAFAEANYIYHEQTTNNPGCGPNYMSTTAPTSALSVQLGWKVEYQFYTTNTVVYYTTDGSTPSGAFGVGSGTTQVLTGSYNCNFGGPVVDVATATIPAQPAGTTVKYIISAWHSGGGAEIFANGPGAPCACGTPTSNSSLATVFQYTVTLSASAVEVYATSGTAYGAYTTLNAAFGAINAGTHQGVINIRINANTTEPAVSVPLLKSGAPSNYSSITIKPYGNVTVNSAAVPTASRGVIELHGADNVTIDGDDPFTAGTRNLSFVSVTSTTTGIAVIRLASTSTTGTDGADNNTVKNCIITGARSSATSTTTSYGINMSNSSSISTGAYSSLNTIIDNNLITRCYHGIYAAGTSATYPNTGTRIRYNTIGSATSADNIGNRGIFITYSAVSSGSAIIHGNDIRVGDYGATGYTATIAGIEVGTVNYGITISNNNIHDINQPNVGGYGAHGIYVTGSTNNTLSYIYNNFIRDCKMVVYQTSKTSTFIPNGVFFTAGATGVNFNYNTIVMNGQLGAGINYSSFCVNASVSGVTFTQFQNNILINNHVSTNAYGFNTAATTNISGGAVNNNDYYVPGGHVGYYNAANQTTLGSWQTATGKDGASVSMSPAFISATDLHMQASGVNAVLNGTGVAVAGITTDYDGETRGATPDIGADEFNVPTCTTADGGTISPSTFTGCAGATYTMSTTGSTSGDGISYQWEVSTIGGGIGFANVVDGTGATTTSYTTGALSVGTYYYRLKVTCTPASLTGYSTEFTLTVNPTPTASAASNSPVCEGAAINLLGTTDIGTTYSWTGPGGYTSSSEDPTIAVAALSNAGVYSFTASLAGCTSPVATTTVAVNAKPTGVTASADPVSLCEGEDISLTSTANPLGYTMNPAGTATFIDIAATGTSVGVLADDSEHNITIPSFSFNGISYTTARIGNNGAMAFGSTSGEIALTNAALPTTAHSAGNILLLPWWDDLDIQMGATIKQETIGSIHVIQFTNMAHDAFTTGAVTFQIQLDLVTGKIHFVYSDVVFGSATYDYGLSSTVGIQMTSTSAVQYSFNTASLANGQCITFTPSSPLFSWSGPDAYTSTDQNPTITAATTDASGIYTVVVTNNITGCTTTASTAAVSVLSNVTYYADVDADTYGDPAASTTSCTGTPVGYVLDNTDCDDTNSAINPAATEVCGNGVDDNCDGNIDEMCTVYTFYADADGDTYGDPAVFVTNYTGIAPVGYVADNTDCDDTAAAINPTTVWYVDADADLYYTGTGITQCAYPGAGYYFDGFIGGGDCDDTNAAINPGATEVCNGLDDDCSGVADDGPVVFLDYYVDADADGYGTGSPFGFCEAPMGWSLVGGDCDDTNDNINPGETEVCNGLDDDCSGVADDGPVVFLDYYVDADADGYGTGSPFGFCEAPMGWSLVGGDCDDADSNINPGETEVCNGLDDDCSGVADDGPVVFLDYYVDVDGDGYGTGSPFGFCEAPMGWSLVGGDCDDADDNINPGETEICNGLDDDCSGVADDGPVVFLDYYVDADGDGYGQGAAFGFCEAPVSGWSLMTGDCDDVNAAINPAATEVCNAIDDDCDGTADDGLTFVTYYKDNDGDGYGDGVYGTVTTCDGAPATYVADNTDCDDFNSAINPAAIELCNFIDDNCSGISDEGLPLFTFYLDGDGDSYGTPFATLEACGPTGPMWVTNNEDCDDMNAAINPLATEVCNSVDDDCNGAIDDGLTFATYYADADGDTYGDAGMSATTCDGAPIGYITDNTDCDDTQATVYPGATEICDGFDNDCDGDYDEGTVTATVTPAGVVSTCKGVPAILSANAGLGYTYQWFKNGNIIAGATNMNYSATKPAFYQVQVNIPEGCFALSPATSVQILNAPNSNISAPLGTSLCTTVKLKASYDATYTWQWLIGGSPIPGATSYLYLPSIPGVYSCTITNATGCSRTTPTITVTACKEGEETVEIPVEVFHMYPNPTDYMFTLDMEINTDLSEAQVFIVNIMGDQVYAGTVGIDHGTVNSTITLDDNIAAGMYVVKVLVADKEYTQQLIIQK